MPSIIAPQTGLYTNQLRPVENSIRDIDKENGMLVILMIKIVLT